MKQYKWYFVAVVVFLLGGYLLYGKGNDDTPAAEHPPFGMSIDGSEMSVWKDGKKRWQLSAASVVTKDNLTIFKGIANGQFIKDEKDSFGFQSATVEVDNTTGDVKFPDGLTITCGEWEIHIETASWVEKASQLEAIKIKIQKKSGNICIETSKVVYDQAAKHLTWPEKLLIVRQEERVEVGANQALYDEGKDQWKIGENVVLTISQEHQKLNYTVRTDVAFLDLETLNVVGPHESDFAGSQVHGRAKNVLWNEAGLVAGGVEISESDQGTWTAGQMVSDKAGKYRFLGNVTGRKGDELVEADEVEEVDDVMLVLTKVSRLVHQGKVLVGDSVKLDKQTGALSANGNVTLKDNTGNVVHSEDLVYDGKNRMQFTKCVVLEQNNGSTISGDAAEYDEDTGRLSIVGHVKVSRTDGRWVKAAKATYDTKEKTVELVGDVESSKNMGR